MAEIHFTSHLRNLVPGAPYRVAGSTVGAALQSVFDLEPKVRGCVLDDRGGLRKHVCVFADGERLAMGSTTGALWFSGNGGERWELIGPHLPPIYAVRFG